MKLIRTVVTCVLWCVANLANASAYTFTDLGTLGGSTSYARAINNAGQVVGWSNTFGNIGNAAVHATLWDGRTTTDLGTLGGPRSFAFAINDAGQVVGASSTPTSEHATLWSGSSHTPVDLGTLGGATSQALAINNAGQIVGYSDTKASAANNFSSANHATLWSGSSYTAVDLGTLGGTHSYAFAINDAGKMAGWSYTTGNIQAAVWNAHHTGTDLGTPLGAYRSAAYAINNVGQVAGFALLHGANRGIVWNGTTATELDALPTASFSDPNAINNVGQVVGDSLIYLTATDFVWHGTIWNGTTATDLNSLLDASTVDAGWVLNNAFGINDNGWIVGNASNSLLGISDHAFLLSVTAIPEPHTYVLMLMGFCLIGFSERRKGGVPEVDTLTSNMLIIK